MSTDAYGRSPPTGVAHLRRRRPVLRRLPAHPLGDLLLRGQRESGQPDRGRVRRQPLSLGPVGSRHRGLALWAGYSLLSGNTFGRVIGYIWGMLVIVQSFMIISYAPWFGFAALLLATLVILALSATSEWRETAV